MLAGVVPTEFVKVRAGGMVLVAKVGVWVVEVVEGFWVVRVGGLIVETWHIHRSFVRVQRAEVIVGKWFVVLIVQVIII